MALSGGGITFEEAEQPVDILVSAADLAVDSCELWRLDLALLGQLLLYALLILVEGAVQQL